MTRARLPKRRAAAARARLCRAVVLLGAGGSACRALIGLDDVEYEPPVAYAGDGGGGGITHGGSNTVPQHSDAGAEHRDIGAGGRDAGAGGGSKKAGGDAAPSAGGDAAPGAGGDAAPGAGGDAAPSAGGDAAPGAGGAPRRDLDEPVASAGLAGDGGSVSAPHGGAAGSLADNAGASGKGVADPWLQLSDEFDAPPLTGWADLHPELYEGLTIVDGRLLLLAKRAANNGWFDNFVGPFLYKTVPAHTDFLVETALRVLNANNRDPWNLFNEAGLLIRDGNNPGESWIKYHLGHQHFEGGIQGRSVISTRRNGGADQSISGVYVNPAGPNGTSARGQLRVCRIGATFHFLFRTNDEASWTEECFTDSTAIYKTSELEPDFTPPAPLRVERLELVGEVQVGLSAGTGDPGQSSLKGEFDFVRFRTPTLAECRRTCPVD
jgi:hypothetical protein